MRRCGSIVASIVVSFVIVTVPTVAGVTVANATQPGSGLVPTEDSEPEARLAEPALRGRVPERRGVLRRRDIDDSASFLGRPDDPGGALERFGVVDPANAEARRCITERVASHRVCDGV